MSFRATVVAFTVVLAVGLPVGGCAGQDAQPGPQLDELMRRMESFGFSGVVLVARGDTVLHAAGYGLADREAERPFTTGSVVSLGSITKVYTAMAVLRLVERGELALEDTLGAFIPDLPPDRSGVTIEQLLTHTSGVGESPYGDVDDVSRELLIEEARTLPLVDRPGASNNYSNLGYSLLGVILEEATGLPYEDALRREVLLPADAFETGYTRAGWEPERVAAGYRDGQRWGTIIEKFPDPSGPSWILKANGGLHATVFDVLRFVRALVDGRILSPERTELVLTPRQRFPAQGFGWSFGAAPDGTRTVEHDGSNGFLTAKLAYLPTHDLTVFVAGNQASFTAMDMMPPVLRLVTGEETPVPPAITASPLGAEERSALAGRWEVRHGRLEVVDATDHLQVRMEGQALLNRVLADADYERLTDHTERAQAWMEAVQNGELPAPVLGRVWSSMEQRFGPIEAVEVMGTAPTWYASPSATWLRFRFRGGQTRIRRLHWGDDGGLYGIGGSVFPAPVTVRCVGTGPGTCTAMHPNLDVAGIRLTRTGEGRTVLHVGGERLDARRIATGMNGSGME